MIKLRRMRENNLRRYDMYIDYARLQQIGPSTKRTFLHGRMQLPARRGSFCYRPFAGRARAQARRRTLGPRAGSVARAIGIQNNASWLFFAGLRSASPSLVHRTK